MKNIDPYNNAPAGSKCGTGKCGTGTQSQQSQPQQPQSQPLQSQPYLQQVPQVPQYTGKTSMMSQRPMQTPGRPDLQTENEMLRSDLKVAIQYIIQLGGRWPPPGH